MPWLIWSAAQTPLHSSPPSGKANVEQVWHTNPLKIPCGHVPKPNQFVFFSFFCFDTPLAASFYSLPCPSPSVLLPLLAVGATYSFLCESMLFIRISFVFASLSLSFRLPAPFQLRQSGLWRRNHAPFQPTPTALAIIQNQSLWFWQLANFSLLYHINFMSLVFAALHRDREGFSRSFLSLYLSLSRTLRAAAL